MVVFCLAVGLLRYGFLAFASLRQLSASPFGVVIFREVAVLFLIRTISADIAFQMNLYLI